VRVEHAVVVVAHDQQRPIAEVVSVELACAAADLTAAVPGLGCAYVACVLGPVAVAVRPRFARLIVCVATAAAGRGELWASRFGAHVHSSHGAEYGIGLEIFQTFVQG